MDHPESKGHNAKMFHLESVTIEISEPPNKKWAFFIPIRFRFVFRFLKNYQYLQLLILVRLTFV